MIGFELPWLGTPNHWHSLITIWAAQAWKHVYVEKPMSHDVGEGRIAVEAQKKYGVVIQHGTQSRSSASIAGLHEAIQSGQFGPLKISYGYCCKQRDSIGFKPISDPPQNLDWNLWRGPAVIDQFHGNYVHYNWHWFWKTGNSDLNNQGTHQLDIARGALDKELTHPVRAMAIGGRFAWNDQGETPNTMMGIAEFPNGQQVFFNVRNVAGRFGDNKEAAEHFLKLHELMRDGVGVPEDGAEYTVGPWLTFDPATETHTGDFAKEANQLLKDPNRSGFEVPTSSNV